MKVTEFVICEDVRQEADGRFSLMGVTHEELTIVSDAQQKDTVLLRIAAFIALSLNESDRPGPFELTVKRQAELLLLVKGSFEGALPARRLQLVAGGEKVKISAPGTVDFLLVIHDTNGNEVVREGKSIAISFAPTKQAMAKSA